VKHPLVALLGAIVALVGAPVCAAADPAASPSASPLPSASLSPAPHRRLIEQGPLFVSVGLAPVPRVASEFNPASTPGRTSFDLWQSGEQRVLGFDVISFNDYRELAYSHTAAQTVTTVGGAGSTIVPAFLVHDWTLENGGGVRVLPQVFAGLAMIDRKDNTGYPVMHGIGYTIIGGANAAAIVSPYGWASYFPNLGGNYALGLAPSTALTYRAFRYRAGLLIREAGTPLAFDAGFDGETLNNRTNAPAHIRDSTFRMGLDFRL
jgi:hypothetical protein